MPFTHKGSLLETSVGKRRRKRRGEDIFFPAMLSVTGITLHGSLRLGREAALSHWPGNSSESGFAKLRAGGSEGDGGGNCYNTNPSRKGPRMWAKVSD